MRNFRQTWCSHCLKELRPEELNKYPLQWQYLEDMYCNKCIRKYNIDREENAVYHKVVIMERRWYG